MEKANKSNNFQSQKESELKKAITDIENQLQKTKKQSADAAATNEEDSLDSYMKSLKEPQLEKQTVSRLKSELMKLKQDYAQVTKLLNLAKPAQLPSLVAQSTSQAESAAKSKLLPVFGKKKKIKVEVPTKSAVVQPEHVGENEEEEEEEEQEGNKVNKSESVSISNKSDTEEKTLNTKEENKQQIIKKTEEVKEQPNTSKSTAPKKKQNEEKNRSIEKKQGEKVKKTVPKQYPKDGYSDDYSMWVPPTNQSGDGRTSLNDKLGY